MRKRIIIELDDAIALPFMRTLVDLNVAFEVTPVPDHPNKPIVVLDTPRKQRGGKPGRLVIAKDGRRIEQVIMDKATSFGDRKFPIADAIGVATTIGFAKPTAWNAVKRLVKADRLERLNASEYRIKAVTVVNPGQDAVVA